MEYMPGRHLGDSLEHLTYQQKLRTATDLAYIMSSMFNITHPDVAVSLRIMEVFSKEALTPVRYLPLAPLYSPRPSTIVNEQLCVGPVTI